MHRTLSVDIANSKPNNKVRLEKDPCIPTACTVKLMISGPAAEVVLPSKLWDTFFTIMTDSMSLASLYCAALHYKGAENAHPNLCKAGVAVMFLCEDLERPDIAVKGPVALRQKKFVEVIEKTAAIVRSLRQEYSKETDPLERMTNDPPLS